MKAVARLLILPFAALLGPAWVEAGPNAEKEYKALNYKSMPYRLLIPENYEKSKRYPLIFFLHGYGERGTDNKSQLNSAVGYFTKPEVREKFPCFVLAPQTSGAWIGVSIPCEKPIPAPKEIPKPIAMALEVLNAVVKAYSVDTQRVYLSGASNGACAAWCLLEHDPRPWAAAVLIAGAGDPRMIAAARDVPIWILHGDKDTTILPERSREMIAALKAAGGTPKYTEVRGGSHGSVIKKGYTEPDLLPWMFEQKRKGAK